MEWAIDVARMLRTRGLQDSGSERSATVNRLVDVLLHQPPPKTWSEIVEKWKEGADGSEARNETLSKRVDRIRKLLTRATAGINTERLKGSAQFRAHVQATNELVTATLLLNSGSQKSARLMYEHVLKISKKYHITDCEIRAAGYLRRMAATTNEPHLFRNHDRELQRLQTQQLLEREAERIEDHALKLLHEYSRNPRTVADRLESLCTEVRTLASASSVIGVQRSMFRVLLWQASMLNRPNDMLHIGTQAITWMNENPAAESVPYRVEFEGSRMSAALMLKDVEGARSAWHDIHHRIEEGTGNWVNLLQLYFLVCMYAEQFDEARDALHLYESKHRRGGVRWRTQLWNLYKAYVFVLIDEGLMQPGQFARSSRMYPATLEATSEDLVRDKPVTNAALLILKVIHWLRAAKYSEVITVTETLRTYASRYLRNPETARTGRLLRMLATLPASDFDAEKAAARGCSIMQKVKNVPTTPSYDAEIIPYETLWDIVLGILQRNASLGRRKR